MDKVSGSDPADGSSILSGRAIYYNLLIWEIFMIIETKRLLLREYTLEDFKDLYEILSDSETMKHYPKPYDEKGTMRWLEWSINNYKQ